MNYSKNCYDIIRRCINADPNYGSIWFHNRNLPYDIPTHILANAQKSIRVELESSRLIYARAILHFIRKSFEGAKSKKTIVNQSAYFNYYQASNAHFVDELLDDFNYCDTVFSSLNEGSHDHALASVLSSPSAAQEKKLLGPLLIECEEGVYSHSDFITGSIQMNRTMYNHRHSDISDETRRKYLFGIDQIVS